MTLTGTLKNPKDKVEVILKWEGDAESKVLEGHLFFLLAEVGKTKLKTMPQKTKKSMGVTTLSFPISYILHKDSRLVLPSLFFFLIVTIVIKCIPLLCFLTAQVENSYKISISSC